MNINVMFRWPIKQTGSKSVTVEIPVSDMGVPILHPDFIRQEHLSEREVDKATDSVLRSVAVIE